MQIIKIGEFRSLYSKQKNNKYFVVNKQKENKNQN